MRWRAFPPQAIRLRRFLYAKDRTEARSAAVICTATNYHPGVVAGVAGLSVMIGSILDYAILTKVFKLRGVSRVKQTAFYQTAVRCFYWRPWQTIVLFAFTPLPYLAIRVLAPSSGYPLWKYVSANVVGRVPRYYLLAMGGAWLWGGAWLSPKYLILMALVVVLIPFLGILLPRRSSTA